MRKIVLALAGLFVLVQGTQLSAQTLKGSRATMRRQNSVAKNEDFTFLKNTDQLWRFVDNGLLVAVQNTKSLKLEGVSFPYTRPAVKMFAQRLASQYKDACGERLVVTSLTRPLSRQPWNASDLSVHPAGMALDLRVSDRGSCRNWLKEALIGLEGKGVIDATREHYPSHFHVAVFPDKYERYVASNGKPAALAKAEPPRTEKAPMKIAHAASPSYASIVPLPAASNSGVHKVRTGETLYSISRKYGVTVVALKRANDLHGSRIRPGQKLAIPTSRGSDAD